MIPHPRLHLSPGARRLAALGTCSSALLLSSSPLAATSETWDGGGGNNLINTAANWTNDTVPVSGDTATWNGTVAGDLSLDWGAVFGGAGAGVQLNIASGQTSPLVLGSSLATTTKSNNLLQVGNITIAAGAGAFTLGDGVSFDNIVLRNPGGVGSNTFTNDSANTATIAANVNFNSGGGIGNRPVFFGGSGNWQVDATWVLGGSGSLIVNKNGSGTFTVTHPAAGSPSFIINAGTVAVGGAGLLGTAGTYSLAITNNGTFAYNSSASQTLSGVMSGGGALSVGAGTLTLTAANTFTGATTVNGGTLRLSGAAGAINSSSSIMLNGAAARLVQVSDVAVTPTVTVLSGTVAGSKTLTTVTVADSSSASVSHGDSNSASLAIGALTFQGDAQVTVTSLGDGSPAPIIVTGALTTTPANGKVTINATRAFWASGTSYRVIDFATSSAAASDFQLGTVSGLTSRQSALIVINPSSVDLLIQGDTPRWTGSQSNLWDTSATNNWALILAGTPTTFANGDLARFDDSATVTNVSIPAPGVSPSLVLFDNSSASFTLSGPAGITGSGSLTKNGSGTVTISNLNSFTGGTLVNAGVLAISGTGALGGATAPVNVAGGALDLGASTTAFGTVTLSGTGTIQNGTLEAAALVGANVAGNSTVAATLTGAGSVLMNGAGGTVTLTAANSHTGGTTVSNGTLALAGSGTLGSASAAVEVNGGVLDLGTTTQTLGAVVLSGPGTIQNGTLQAASVSATNAAGTAVLAANLAGAGSLTKSGAGILAVSGTNAHLGGTTVTSGTLQLGNAGETGTLPVDAPITLASGATFGVNRTNAAVQGVDFGLITGAGGIVSLSGTGTTTFNALNTYTGATNITNGRLAVGLSEAAGTGLLNVNGFNARLQLLGGVTLSNQIQTGGLAMIQNVSGNNTLNGNISFGNFGSLTTTIATSTGSLTLNGTISATLGLNRVYLFSGFGNTTVNGAIVDGTTAGSNVGLTKNESGLLRLTGVNTYTGPTFINGGNFRIDGSIAPHPLSLATTNIEIAELGTLSGTGVVAGNLSIYGTLRPGAGGAPGGVLRLDSNAITIDSFTGVTQFDIVGTSFTGLKTTVPGALNYNGALRLNFTGSVFNGSYPLFDLASAAGGNFWEVTVQTTTGNTWLADAGGTWSGELEGVTYSFSTATGVLTVSGAADAVTPGETTLSAVAGNASVALSWTAATGADTYTLRRSTTSGSGFVVIADGLTGLTYTDETVVNDTPYYYTVQGRNTASTFTGPVSNEASATPSAPAFSAQQNWRQLYFGSMDNIGAGADDQDPDNDGLNNLGEYALGGHPLVADASTLVVVERNEAGTLLRARFNALSDPTIAYTVQGSSNLIGAPAWSTIATFPGSAEVAGAVTVLDTALLADNPRRFLRVSVSYVVP